MIELEEITAPFKLYGDQYVGVAYHDDITGQLITQLRKVKQDNKIMCCRKVYQLQFNDELNKWEFYVTF